MICTVSCVGTVLSLVFCCCFTYSFSCVVVSCNFSSVSFTSINFSTISSLYFSTSYHASTVRYCTFSATSSVSFSVIVNSGTPLCTFIFLHWPTICNNVLFIGIVSVCAVVTGMYIYGISPPHVSSGMGIFVSFCAPPFGSTVCSFSYTKGFGIVCFCLVFIVVVLPLVPFACSVSFLLFSVGLVDYFEGPSFTCFLAIGTLFGITGTFHSSGQSFMAHSTYYRVTQYLNCSHSFLGSLLA
jgi:hypothetical protein